MRPIPGFARAHTPPAYAPDPELDPQHLDLDLRVSLDARRVEGVARWTVRSVRAGARALRLDAVDFVSISAEGEGLSARYDGEALHVRWDEAVAPGEGREVTVRFVVERPLAGLVFGEPPFRFVASDHETSRARYWLPCVDHPVVRTRVAVAITAEAGLTALSAGRLVSREENGDGTATTRYQLDARCPAYLLCVAVGDLVVFDDGEWRGRPVRAYAPRPHPREALERAFSPTKGMLDYLSDKLGVEMPWPKYEQLAVPGIGGAMENISLVSWDDAFLPDARLHAEYGEMLDLVNLHEMAHTWFGDLVVCREFAHAWLKESWATYMESVWLEDTEGPEAMQGQLHEEAVAYTAESDHRYARPIVTRHFETGWDMYDGHLYPGGALRLHMLRRELGDDAFWAGVRDYLRRYQGRVVDTADFRKAMEEASGRNLNAFFDQWLHSPGYPKLDARFEHDAEARRATLTLTQTQEDADRGVGLFRFPLVVAVQAADGAWSRHTLRVEGRVAALSWACEAAPLAVILDPDHDALFKVDFNPGRELLQRALTGPSVRGRIQAAEALTAHHGRGGVQAVRAAWPQEPQWRVRRAWARHLGACVHEEAALALGELLFVEQDARVLRVLGQACEKHRHPALAEAMRRWLEGGERPYLATGHVLSALGRQRGDAHLDLLTRFAGPDPFWGWIRRGAFQGLGHTWTPEAFDLLSAALDDPTLRRQERIIAAAATAECARALGREARLRAVDRLSALGAHADYGTRMAAAGALATLGEAGGVAGVLAVSRRVSVQDRPRVERMAEGLRGASDDAAAKRQLEELTDRLRKLEALVEGLSARDRSP